MGSFLRSEEMVLCEIFIQSEVAYSTVADLGESGLVQFRDLNDDMNSFQRRFASMVKTANEMERRLYQMAREIAKEGMRIPHIESSPPAPNLREIQELEAHLEKSEGQLTEVSDRFRSLKSSYLQLVEMKCVLEQTKTLFDEQVECSNENEPLIHEDPFPENSSQVPFSFVSGVIPIERIPGFERMLWRISKGYIILRLSDIEETLQDPKTGCEIKKSVFVAFFQGEKLKSNIYKVCSGFRATVYHFPESAEEHNEMLNRVNIRMNDLKLVLNTTEDLKYQLLSSIAKDFQKWSIMLKKMKAVYHALNMFDLNITKKCFTGVCWIPRTYLQQVKETLGNRSVPDSVPSFLNVINTTEVPPTFHQTNKFTNAFQTVINAYGVASYRELNPAMYTIITFPFLFSVMFGDCGHGLIVTIFSAWMIIFEKKLGKNRSDSEIWNIFFGGRYLILLMGLFSIYAGLIYNDIFSKSINIFGSSWRNPYDKSILQNKTMPFRQLDPAEHAAYKQIPYPYGMDPVWQLASSNKIVFQNSFKMKLSIIIGVAHMLLGVILSAGNQLYFKNSVSIVLEFIPQILFLILLFLYLVILMFMKWSIYDASKPLEWGTRCAPSVLITFINMMLFKPSPVGEGCLPGIYPYQEYIQMTLLSVALLCIPLLLLGKPIYVILKRRRIKRTVCTAGSNQQSDELIEVETSVVDQTHSEDISDSEAISGHLEEEPLSEICIYQAIHTIEYVLSTISHTASYLRLWALSLAHGQLSEVLWNMVFQKGIKIPGYFGSVSIYIIFSVWAIFTLAILVLMEGLSAFLHTLRLHWVEFMSKFYTGSGYPYQPFSFKTVLHEEGSGT